MTKPLETQSLNPELRAPKASSNPEQCPSSLSQVWRPGVHHHTAICNSWWYARLDSKHDKHELTLVWVLWWKYDGAWKCSISRAVVLDTGTAAAAVSGWYNVMELK